MAQTRKGSTLEAATNMIFGMALSWFVGLLVYPMMGFEITHAQNTTIVVLFTLVSLIRSYALRRIFNGLAHRTTEIDAQKVKP